MNEKQSIENIIHELKENDTLLRTKYWGNNDFHFEISFQGDGGVWLYVNTKRKFKDNRSKMCVAFCEKIKKTLKVKQVVYCEGDGDSVNPNMISLQLRESYIKR